MIYLWNGFSIIGRHYNLVESVYVAVQVVIVIIITIMYKWATIIITIMIIEVSLDFNQEAEQTWKSESFSTENSSLLLLLRGVCLRYMGGALIF